MNRQLKDLQKLIHTAPFLNIRLEIETLGIKEDFELPLYLFYDKEYVHPEWELRRN